MNLQDAYAYRTRPSLPPERPYAPQTAAELDKGTYTPEQIADADRAFMDGWAAAKSRGADLPECHRFADSAAANELRKAAGRLYRTPFPRPVH